MIKLWWFILHYRDSMLWCTRLSLHFIIRSPVTCSHRHRNVTCKGPYKYHRSQSILHKIKYCDSIHVYADSDFSVFSAFKTPWLESLLSPQLKIHFIGFQLRNQSILNLLLLSTVHSTTLALNTWHIYYILIRHRVSFALPPSISFPNLVSTLLLPLVVFDTLALLFGFPSLIILDLPTLTLSSNPI